AVVIVVYTVLGGFRAVSVTHSVQAALMFCAAVALPTIGIGLLGGFGALHGVLVHKTPSLLDMGAKAGFDGSRWDSGEPLTAVAVISLLAWGLGYFGEPHIRVRFMIILSTFEI